MTSTKTPQTTYPATDSAQRSLSRRAWRSEVYDALSNADMEKLAKRFASCVENSRTKVKPGLDTLLPDNAEMVYVCTGNHHHEAVVQAQTCDLRICPDCAHRHVARLTARYAPVMFNLFHSHHRRYRFRHIVFTRSTSLTDPDSREQYIKGFADIKSVMDDLLPLGWNKTPEQTAEYKTDANRQGYIVAAEFGETGHKLHYHVIHWGQYLNQSDLSRLWREKTDNNDRVVRVYGFPGRDRM